MPAENALIQEPRASCAVERPSTERQFLPRVDIFETGQELVLVADLPGAQPGTLDVRYEDGTLELHAQVPARTCGGGGGGGGGGCLLREYGVGDFRRSFAVGEELDASRIQAEFRDGVLTVRLPKLEAAQPRKIAVKVC